MVRQTKSGKMFSHHLGDDKVHFQTGKTTQRAHGTWFRGENCNFNPDRETLSSPGAPVEYILKGWLPPAPVIGPDTAVVAFGSCFAAHITRWLAQRNFNVLTAKSDADAGDENVPYIVRYGEGMVNSFVLRQQFEWAFEGKTPKSDLWHGKDGEALEYSEEVRLQTRAAYDRADVFVITLGLSEVWYDAPTGDVFWRAVPQASYDPERHKFRVSTVQENRDNILAIRALIAKHRPDARVIFTLSPIPLVATFRPVSAITANAVSKAVLRAAIDEALHLMPDDDQVFYWPSYEIVTEVFANRWDKDRRHLHGAILDYVMTLFETVWCHGTTPAASLDEMAFRAQAACRAIPGPLMRAVNNEDIDAVAAALARINPRHEYHDLIRAGIAAIGTRKGGDLGARLVSLANGMVAADAG